MVGTHPDSARRRVKVQLRPYVVETGIGPVEVADLYFADGSATRFVPFRSFKFVE